MIDSDRLDQLAAVWTVLSRLLASPPDADVLAQLRSPAFLDDWPLGHSPLADQGVAAWREGAVQAESQEHIVADHARLLVGPGHVLVSPYESVHRSEDHLLFEAETLAVRAAYAEMRLQAPRLNREPDDHIALELEFLGTLALRALDALEASDADRATRAVVAHDTFLDEHLDAWGPQFFTQLGEHAQSCFYRGLSLLGRDALERGRAG